MFLLIILLVVINLLGTNFFVLPSIDHLFLLHKYWELMMFLCTKQTENVKSKVILIFSACFVFQGFVFRRLILSELEHSVHRSKWRLEPFLHLHRPWNVFLPDQSFWSWNGVMEKMLTLFSTVWKWCEKMESEFDIYAAFLHFIDFSGLDKWKTDICWTICV